MGDAIINTLTMRRFPAPSAILELLKPITWFPPMWAFACGVIATGVSFQGRWHLLIAGVILAGPMVCAASQAVNDWFDREVDAINEPQRPIPSGRMPGAWGLYVAIIWTGLSLLLGWFISPWAFAATLLGLLLAWFYSMPPLRFKQNGWLGNAACGISYEGLAWFTGSAVMMGDLIPSTPSILLAILYSIGAHGIMTLNDFKAIEGDRQMGVLSLPVQLGVAGAAENACLMMLAPQFGVFGLLLIWGAYWQAGVIVLLIAGQMVMMRNFLLDPVKRALFLSGFGVPLFVAGMMVSAFAVAGRFSVN
jgi:chlorophyll synthase